MANVGQAITAALQRQRGHDLCGLALETNDYAIMEFSQGIVVGSDFTRSISECMALAYDWRR